jgi:outer membrane protein
MTPAFRFFASVLIAAISAGPLAAADVAGGVAEPPPPSFFVHAGALGVFPSPNAQATGGGLFPISNIAIRPNYTLGLDAGYFVTPNFALALSVGVPPLAHLKATGFAGALPGYYPGSNLLGSLRYGPAIALLQYHLTQFGNIQPYAGIGVGYLFNFGNISDGILTNFSVDQNFSFVLQGGVDLMLTPNWGVYVDAKRVFLSTNAQGFGSAPGLPGRIPVRTQISLDAWLISTGVAFKF